MQNRVYRLIALAAGLMLASACSGDNPAAPAESASNGASVPLASAIKSDIAASAGNAIASDVESLNLNEIAAVGSFASLAFSSASLGGETSSSTPPSNPSNCTAGPSAGVYYCVKEPGPGDHLKCSYSEEKKLFVCVKQEAPDSSPPPSGDKPEQKPESCSFNAASLFYSCSKSVEGKSTVKSYQFLDASGKAMERFVKGVTESIQYRVQTDASESSESSSSVSHSLRYLKVSGFLGPNRVWNGFGSNADTSSRREELSSRRYAGLSVDTLKAVTFVDERAAHPYPLSGVAIKVVDYTVVSTGRQTETLTVHKRVVVTFNGSADVPISLGDYTCVLHLDTKKVDGCR